MIPRIVGADPSEFILPPRGLSSPLVDSALGTARSDGVGPRNVEWRGTWESGSAILTSPSEVVSVPAPEAVRIAFDFDLAMSPVLAYEVGGVTHLRWFSGTVGDFVVTEFPGMRDCCVMLDDSRPISATLSDVVLSGVEGGDLVTYVQRERYAVRHVLASGLTSAHRVLGAGFTRGNRLQWQITPPLN